MKFKKILGNKNDPKIMEMVKEAEKKLSSVFTELAISYDNRAVSKIGGDPLIFQLVSPLDHICDARGPSLDLLIKSEGKEEAEKIFKEEENNLSDEDKKYVLRKLKHKTLSTAATDGFRFFWNPEFVCKKDKMGLRIVVAHEAGHSLYMHPRRRGKRHPGLWNISVDFKVNYTIMDDLKIRNIKEPEKLFTEALGEFIRLEEYAQFLADPFNPPARLAHFNPMHALKKMADPGYDDPASKAPPMYFADANLNADFKKPEHIYFYLWNKIPRCPECGKVNYNKPKEYNDLLDQVEKQQKEKQEKQKEENQEDKTQGNKEESSQDNNKPSDDASIGQQGDASHTHEENDKHSCDNGNHSCCPSCGQGDGDESFDPIGIGETLDEHIDSDISEEEMNKRMYEAIESAKRLAGKIPGSLEDELGKLIAPKMTWEDFVRSKITKKRRGVGRNDWQTFKHRPVFAGLYVPRKRDNYVNILAAYDCSGSMSKDDIAYGISQLQVIDERGEIYLVPWDTQAYFDKMVKVKNAKKEELVKANVVGRGGTMVGDVFRRYKEFIKEPLDIIIIISDGFLYPEEMKDISVPRGTDVIWVITSNNHAFKPPIGRTFHIKNDSL